MVFRAVRQLRSYCVRRNDPLSFLWGRTRQRTPTQVPPLVPSTFEKSYFLLKCQTLNAGAVAGLLVGASQKLEPLCLASLVLRYAQVFGL